jgi:hypothetical protein
MGGRAVGGGCGGLPGHRRSLCVVLVHVHVAARCGATGVALDPRAGLGRPWARFCEWCGRQLDSDCGGWEALGGGMEGRPLAFGGQAGSRARRQPRYPRRAVRKGCVGQMTRRGWAARAGRSTPLASCVPFMRGHKPSRAKHVASPCCPFPLAPNPGRPCLIRVPQQRRHSDGVGATHLPEYGAPVPELRHPRYDV